tara:strand:+ start:748 stop:1653 length:906 start_codon:yes stop_codon:yes gene_type:complete
VRIIILGPTASGKTELSLLLADALDTSIISADSRQCYKYMDIGTAKPSADELARATHFNISNLEPFEDDSAVKFHERAAGWEKQILKDSDHVIYVGGSTLHLTGLIQPFDNIPDSNQDNIDELNARIQKEGIESLYEQLKEVDPEYIPKLDGMNKHRIIRALDVWMQTGKPFSSFHNELGPAPDEHTLVFGLKWNRQTLYDRINRRVEQMLEQGLLKEVQTLLNSGYSKDLQSLQTVGYREVILFFEGDYTLEQMKEKIKTNTRRYAKRQLTWFRRWDFIDWLDAEHAGPERMRDHILSKL